IAKAVKGGLIKDKDGVLALVDLE
ncbi:uncharacterized protein METZ01_LOCUS506884, partial [marine metagenome]